MKQHDVGISFASDDERYAAALYRRLAERLEVFFSPSAPISSDDPQHLADELKLTYEQCSLVVVVVGPTYATKDWTNWECAEAVQRLRAGKLDCVQLIRRAECRWPASLQAHQNILGRVGFELPDHGWELAMDEAVRVILTKLQRLAVQPGYLGPSTHPFPLRRYQHSTGPRVPIPVARHFPSLKPLFPVPPQSTCLTEYVVESVQGYAALHGHVEQLRRANALSVALGHLAACSTNAGESLQRLEAGTRAAAKKVLSCLRSADEVQRAMVGIGWNTPDDAQLLQRLRHYFIRHLNGHAVEPMALVNLVDALTRLLCKPPARAWDRRLLLEQISSDAVLSAESIHRHFWPHGTGRAARDQQEPSPTVLQCTALMSTLQRQDTWGNFD